MFFFQVAGYDRNEALGVYQSCARLELGLPLGMEKGHNVAGIKIGES